MNRLGTSTILPGVYRRGMDEVAALLASVQTRPS